MGAQKYMGILALAFAASCQAFSISRELPQVQLASFQRASDFDTYRINRLGILPAVGSELTDADSSQLQELLYSEFASSTPIEIVLLNTADLMEITASDPHQRGTYRAETVLEISRRFHLDGILVPTVIQRRAFPPQRLSLSVDLVSSETGMAIWNGGINLMGGNMDVEEGLEAFYGNGKVTSDDSWTVSLLSPSQFARYAAWQIAQGL